MEGAVSNGGAGVPRPQSDGLVGKLEDSGIGLVDLFG